MKIDFSKSILEIDGTEAYVDEKKEKKLTLKKLCEQILSLENKETMEFPSDKKLMKFKLMVIFAMCKDPSSVELQSEEITFLKEMLVKFAGALVVGQAYAMLEGKESELAALAKE